MKKHQPSKPNGNPTTSCPTAQEQINYRSPDGLFVVVTKTRTARRYPAHDYPVVCIRVRPKSGSRIQQLDNDEGVEILCTHKEISQHLKSLNAADAKASYTWKDIPEKTPERKAQWARFNDQRRNRSH